MFNILKKVVLAPLLALSFVLPAVTLTVNADVYVSGYTRKDGTYVQSHYRSSPDGNPYNNWSYPGNTNPYTGVTAGGNSDTYLRNYYNNTSSQVSPNTYTSTYTYPSTSYTPSYSSVYESVYGGYKSYGVLFCNYGYYEVGEGCKKAPENGYALSTTFYCNYGYEKSGEQCLKTIPANAYRTSTLDWACSPGYAKVNSVCEKNIINASVVNNKWQCNSGHVVSSNDPSSCIPMSSYCQITYGNNTVVQNGNCQCAQGYAWSDVSKTCTLAPQAQSKDVQNIEEMKKQIQNLLAMVAILQAQLANTKTSAR